MENDIKSKQGKEKDDDQKQFINPSDAMSIGLNMTVGFCIFTFVGYQVDKWTGAEYWTLAGVFVGLLYCGYETWKLVRNKQ